MIPADGSHSNFCSGIYGYWQVFVTGQHAINHTYRCEEVYPDILDWFGVDQPVNCTEKFDAVDNNEDGLLNLRETGVLAMEVINNFETNLKMFFE